MFYERGHSFQCAKLVAIYRNKQGLRLNIDRTIAPPAKNVTRTFIPTEGSCLAGASATLSCQAEKRDRRLAGRSAKGNDKKKQNKKKPSPDVSTHAEVGPRPKPGTDLTVDPPPAPDPLSLPAYKNALSLPSNSPAAVHASRLDPPLSSPQPRRDLVVDAAARPLLQPPLPELLPLPPRHRGVLIPRTSFP